MEEYLAALLMASWLGILTAISPCPLASNIAAVTFLSRGFDREHLDMDLIKMKQFIITRQFSDEEVLDSNFLDIKPYKK